MVKPLSLQHLQFRNVRVRCIGPTGYPFVRLVRVGMPKVPQQVIKCVFYLYETVEDARAGTNPQGTGFLVSVPHGRKRGGALAHSVYAVANWHVTVDNSDPESPPCPIIRFNGLNATDPPAVLPFTPRDWRYIPGGVDVAVVPIEDPENYDVLSVPVTMFIRPSDIAKEKIGIGDDVFMMGLFIDHHGGPRNVPAARFGNISMVPSEHAPIPQPNIGEAEAFVLDLHSRSGFSGSPAFMYRTFGSDLTTDIGGNFRVRFDSRSRDQVSLDIDDPTLFKFLGIHFGQFSEEDRKRDFPSGMTTVVPAWRIMDVLNLPEFADM